MILENSESKFPRNPKIPLEPWIGILPNFFDLIQYGMPFFPSSVAVNKNYCLKSGGFPVGVNRGGDKIAWIQMGIKYPIAFSSSYQAIYHTDAINRVTNMYDRSFDVTQFLDKLIDSSEVPVALIGDLKNYNAHLKINKSRHMISEGQGQLVGEMLRSIKSNRRYRKEWIQWYFWSKMPTSVIRFFQRLRR